MPVSCTFRCTARPPRVAAVLVAASMQPAPPVAPVASLQQLIALQRSRAEIYRRFEDGFKKFLIEGNDERAYQELVQAITPDFSRVSLGVRTVEAQLRSSGRLELADLCLRLQSGEKDKLVFTANVHVKKRQIAVLEQAKEFVEPTMEYELRGLVAELQSTVVDINEVLEEVQGELSEMLAEDGAANGGEEP